MKKESKRWIYFAGGILGPVLGNILFQLLLSLMVLHSIINEGMLGIIQPLLLGVLCCLASTYVLYKTAPGFPPIGVAAFIGIGVPVIQGILGIMLFEHLEWSKYSLWLVIAAVLGSILSVFIRTGKKKSVHGKRRAAKRKK